MNSVINKWAQIKEEREREVGGGGGGGGGIEYKRYHPSELWRERETGPNFRNFK